MNNTPLLGWKSCQAPHNSDYASGVDKPDWLESVLYIAIGATFIAVTAVSKGWL